MVTRIDGSAAATASGCDAGCGFETAGLARADAGSALVVSVVARVGVSWRGARSRERSGLRPNFLSVSAGHRPPALAAGPDWVWDSPCKSSDSTDAGIAGDAAFCVSWLRARALAPEEAGEISCS